MNKFNILIVDDVDDNLHSLELIINDNFDVNIYKALDAKTAISIVMTNRVDLILSDVQMPEINGFEFAEYLKSIESTKDIPIVFLTGIYDQDKYKTKAYNLGAIEYITKPIDTQILISKLSIYIKLFNALKVSAQEIKDNEKLLIESTKMASMGEMVGFISHQLKQPLSTLSMQCQKMKISHNTNEITDEEIKAFSKSTESQIGYMNDTIEGFLNFYNPQKIEKEFLVDIAIQKALDILNSKIKINQINIFENIDSTLCIRGIQMELTQVIINIVSNAIDACIMNNIEIKNIYINVYKNEENIILTIEDNAGGVEEEKLENIINPYFTTKQNGSGLGLYMVDMIIKNSFKSKLEFSNADGGLKFKIVFNN